MKVCIKCNIEKPKTEFSIKNNSKDGYYYYCKQCVKENIKCKEWYKNQYQNNKEYRIKWENDKYKSNPQHKLKNNLRCRLNSILSKQKVYKNNTTIKYLGCSLDEYKLYLESRFQNDMNWNNHGILWEVDHIIPCSSFDLSIEDNIYKCFNYTNTQPLYKSINRSKKDKL